MLEKLPQKPLDAIFKLFYEFLADEREEKINLGIGLYSDIEGHPFVFPCVQLAYDRVDTENFNYQPIGGNRQYLEETAKLLFEDNYYQEKLAMQATCGGTQACRLFADIMLMEKAERQIFIATPAWGNYNALFNDLKIVNFPHLKNNSEIDFDAYLNAIKQANPGDIFVIQGALTHNPCGLNLSIEQLSELILKMNEKELVLYMDMAYLGLGDGINEDKAYAQLAAAEANNFAIGVSFSKNAALYEHRTGALYFKTDNAEAVESQIQGVVRQSISTPPGLGQDIMADLLVNYQKEWLQELEDVRQDVVDRKTKLVNLLGKEFQFLHECRGMFGLLPLSEEQIERMKSEFAVYLLKNGRVNFSGLTEKSIPLVAKAINAVC